MSDKERRFPVRDKRVTSSDEPTEDDARTDEPAPEGDREASDVERLAEERLDQLMRLKADFENFRQRMIREKTELVDMASLRIVERVLPVLDDLDRAIESAREHKAGEPIVKGFELVANHLHKILDDEGLERMKAEGEFDPHRHEAVSSVVGEVSAPTILEVVRPGYSLKGKTVRPALVHVTVPPPAPEHNGEGEG